MINWLGMELLSKASLLIIEWTSIRVFLSRIWAKWQEHLSQSVMNPQMECDVQAGLCRWPCRHEWAGRSRGKVGGAGRGHENTELGSRGSWKEPPQDLTFFQFLQEHAWHPCELSVNPRLPQLPWLSVFYSQKRLDENIPFCNRILYPWLWLQVYFSTAGWSISLFWEKPLR